MGLEAASRGAAEVVLVERNRMVARALQENIKTLGFSNVALHVEDGLEFIRQQGKPFDVVFLDPPFRSKLLPELLPLLPARLAENGMVYVESGEPFAPDATWDVVRQAKAGAVYYQLLRHTKA